MVDDAGSVTTPHGPPVVRVVQLDDAPLLTVRDVARLLAVSTATVYALVDRGELPHVRVNNAIRIAPSELAAYLAR